MTSTVVALVLALLACASHAHKASDSYLSIAALNQELRAHWNIAIRDLEFAIGLDTNDDGLVTWGELRRKQQLIESYVLARLSVSSGGQPCSLRTDGSGLQVARYTDGAYAVLSLAMHCGAGPVDALTLGYNLFFDLDAQHRGLLRLQRDGTIQPAVFSPDARLQTLTMTRRNPLRRFFAYAREGVWHIWIGHDHILLLVSLLLPSVLEWESRRWQSVTSFCVALMDTVRIVAAFTVAHSITLSLAVLGIVAPVSPRPTLRSQSWTRSGSLSAPSTSSCCPCRPAFACRRFPIVPPVSRGE